MASSIGFFSLEVRIDVDVVLVVDEPDVAAEGHRLETVPAQERDFGSSVAPPLLRFSAFCQLPLDYPIPLQLRDLDAGGDVETDGI